MRKRLLATRSVRILTVPLLLAGMAAGVGVASVTAAAATSTSAAAAGPTLSELYGVSCTSPKACTAVGSSGKATTAASLAERWNGTKWTIQSTPKPAGATTAQLNAVSCASPTACIAVGISRGHSGLAAPLAERWNGTKWVITPAPKPAHAVTAEFYGVSCTSPTACTAVGTTFPKDLDAVVLAEGWNGKKWTAEPTPGSPGGFPVEFASVSCTSPTACTAVGDATPEGYSVIAERWNGAKWAITPALAPSGEHYPALYGVSCTSSAACTAVGQANNGAGITQALLAEAWNGKKWTIQRTPTP